MLLHARSLHRYGSWDNLEQWELTAFVLQAQEEEKWHKHTSKSHFDTALG